MNSEEQRIKNLKATVALTKTGYAGIDKEGNIVDRRKHPNAIPIQKNSVFGTPDYKMLDVPESWNNPKNFTPDGTAK